MNRGIGVSRPHTLRGFPAGWIDWGRLDFEAVLGHAATAFAGEPIAVVARSVGGLLIGLTPSNYRIHRVFTMGAQFAHWRDYARAHRVRLLLKWHLEMPALTTLLGYFPGRRLGWMEDAPCGVVRDWTARSPRFEDAYRRGARVVPPAEGAQPVRQFAAMAGATLAVSVRDDEFGTIPAIRRLLARFTNSLAVHLQLPPQATGVGEIGHLAVFHSRVAQTLGPIARRWLGTGDRDPELTLWVQPKDGGRFGVPKPGSVTA